MKYFLQIKFREFQMTPKLRILDFFIVISFQILHFGPQIFKLTPINFQKNCKSTPQIFQNYNLTK
jgi:hypothetical protein